MKSVLIFAICCVSVCFEARAEELNDATFELKSDASTNKLLLERVKMHQDVLVRVFNDKEGFDCPIISENESLRFKCRQVNGRNWSAHLTVGALHAAVLSYENGKWCVPNLVKVNLDFSNTEFPNLPEGYIYLRGLNDFDSFFCSAKKTVKCLLVPKDAVVTVNYSSDVSDSLPVEVGIIKFNGGEECWIKAQGSLPSEWVLSTTWKGGS